MAVELAHPPTPAQPQLRSEKSLQESFVLFKNTTNRNINLYWVDYNGTQKFLLALRPYATSRINTFRLHPWIFRDRSTGERMQVAQQNTFWPQPYLMRDPLNHNHWIPCRKQIDIHFPVRPLRENCLWHVVEMLTSACYSTTKTRKDAVSAAIEALRVPRTLKSDMELVLRSIEKHRANR